MADSGDLIVPRSLAVDAVNARMAAQAQADIEEARKWTEELRRIDPKLSLVFIPDHADEFDDPGRWHLRKELPGEYDEYWPLLGPGGSYKAPGSWLLDHLEANDLWNPRVHRDKKEAREKYRQAKARARALEAEQRQDEMALANRAAKRIKGDSGMYRRNDLKGRRPAKPKPEPEPSPEIVTATPYRKKS